MDQLGLTAAGLARLLGRSRAAVAAYRTGAASIPSIVAARLLRIKDTIDALASEVGND